MKNILKTQDKEVLKQLKTYWFLDVASKFQNHFTELVNHNKIYSSG